LQEKRWIEARTKKVPPGVARLCSVKGNGCIHYGYFIPESGVYGCGNLYIPIKPQVIQKQEDVFALTKEEFGWTVGNNIVLSEEIIFSNLGGFVRESWGEFQILPYKDNYSPESGVKIEKKVPNEAAPGLSDNFEEKSIRSFLKRLFWTSLIMEPVVLPKELPKDSVIRLPSSTSGV
jgi:hypothetical protein